MTFIFAVFVLVCFYKAKFSGINKLHNDYISPESTNAINGIFVFLIVIGHYVQHYTAHNQFDAHYLAVRSFLGQMVVATFFVYSGYGIFESYKKKGTAYIASFPKNRLPKLLLHLDFAVIIYTILFLILGRKITLRQFAFSLIGWEQIGNNNWFVFATLIFYIFTFVVLMLIKKDNFLAISIITMLTLAYIFVIRTCKDTYWYNSVICYPLGMWYSYFKLPIERTVAKNNITYYLSLALSLGSFVAVKYAFGGFRTVVTTSVCCALFAISIILISMKIRVGNPVLDWLGKHAFSIYMLQRIPFIIFRQLKIINVHPYICFAVSLLIIIISAEIFDKVTIRADKKLFK